MRTATAVTPTKSFTTIITPTWRLQLGTPGNYITLCLWFCDSFRSLGNGGPDLCKSTSTINVDLDLCKLDSVAIF